MTVICKYVDTNSEIDIYLLFFSLFSSLICLTTINILSFSLEKHILSFPLFWQNHAKKKVMTKRSCSWSTFYFICCVERSHNTQAVDRQNSRRNLYCDSESKLDPGTYEWKRWPPLFHATFSPSLRVLQYFLDLAFTIVFDVLIPEISDVVGPWEKNERFFYWWDYMNIILGVFLNPSNS
jgi:hypothetical protein